MVNKTIATTSKVCTSCCIKKDYSISTTSCAKISPSISYIGLRHLKQSITVEFEDNSLTLRLEANNAPDWNALVDQEKLLTTNCKYLHLLTKTSLEKKPFN